MEERGDEVAIVLVHSLTLATQATRIFLRSGFARCDWVPRVVHFSSSFVFVQITIVAQLLFGTANSCGT